MCIGRGCEKGCARENGGACVSRGGRGACAKGACVRGACMSSVCEGRFACKQGCVRGGRVRV